MLNTMNTTNAKARVPCISPLEVNAVHCMPQRIRVAQCLQPSLSSAVRATRPNNKLVAARRQPQRMIIHAAAASHGENSASPLQTLNRFVIAAVKFVHEAVLMIQRLFQLLQRVRTAAKSIQDSVETSSSSPVQQLQPSNTPSPSSSMPNLQRMSLFKATLGAITHLRHTLTDATGTLDAKWNALSTTSDTCDSLFNATTASAAVVNNIQQTGGKMDKKTRTLARQSNEAVIKEEEALRQQVFAQVYAELKMQAHQKSNTTSTSSSSALS